MVPHASPGPDLGAGDLRSLDTALRQMRRGLPPTLLLELVRGLLARGLPAIGSSLLRTVGAPLLADPAVAQLADQLASMRTRSLPRERQRTIARSMLATLALVRAEVPDEAVARLDDDSVDVLVDRDGLALGVARARGTLSFAVAPRWVLDEAEARLIANAWPPLVALAGLPSEHLLRQMFAVDNGRPVPPAYVAFESDPVAIAAWLRAGDMSESLRSGRLQVRLGGDAIERHLERMVGSLSLAVPSLALVLRPECPIARECLKLPGRCARVWQDERDIRTRQAIDRAAARPRGELSARFRAARDAGGALRIAGIVSRRTKVVSGMMRDLLHAFEAMGHVTTLITETDDALPSVETAGPFSRDDFDLAIAINYLRRHPSELVPVDVPFVSWMQDAVDFAMTPEAGAKQGPTDLLVAASPGFWESNFGYPRGQSVTASNVTSWGLYGALGEAPRQGGAPDVVYVGHGWESPEAVAMARAESDPARRVLSDIVVAFRERLAAGSVPNGFERMRIEAQCLARRGHEAGASGQAMYWVTQAIFDRMFRHEALEWAARWADARGKRFRIFGEGWERHPTLGRFAAGPVENGEALGRLCRDAGAVLHANGNASLHQRLLDGVAAGGCVLTRRNPADEIAGHVRALARLVRDRGIGTLDELHRRVGGDEELRQAVAGVERSLGCAVRPCGTAEREADRRTIDITGFWPAETLTDEGLFRHLTSDGGIMPTQGAADLKGFPASCFASETELCDALDRVTSDDAARRAVAAPMRAAVRERFTMELVARAIVERMTECVLKAGR